MNYTLDKKIVFRAIALFVLLFAFLTIPYTKLGFDSDCFGFIYHSAHNGGNKEFFNKSICQLYLSPNEAVDEQVISRFYRPLMLVFSGWLFPFFGTNAYPYYVFSIFFHVLSFVLMYLLFLYLIPDPYAWLLALLAALHPAHTPSLIGLTFFHTTCYTFCISAAFVWLMYAQRRRWYLYALSGLLFFTSLFMYEMPLVFPFVVFGYLFLFNRKNLFKDSWLFFVCDAIYGLMRYQFIGKKSFNTGISAAQLIPRTLDNFIQSIKPFFGMQDCSWAVVGFIILMISCSLAGYFWINGNKDRLKMLFYMYAFCWFSWAIVVCHSASRYYYLAVPFFCLILYELLQFIADSFGIKRKPIFILTILFICIGWSGVHTTKYLLRRVVYTNARDKAICNLSQIVKTPTDTIIYLGTVQSIDHDIFIMFSGMTQATKLFLNNDHLKVYHAPEVALFSRNGCRAPFKVIPVTGGYRFISQEPKDLFIMALYSWREEMPIPFSLGTIVPHKIKDGWMCSDVSYLIDKKWLSDLKHTHIVTWRPDTWEFEELKSDHLQEGLDS